MVIFFSYFKSNQTKENNLAYFHFFFSFFIPPQIQDPNIAKMYGLFRSSFGVIEQINTVVPIVY